MAGRVAKTSIGIRPESAAIRGHRKILQAAEKVGVYESRITCCEGKTDENKKQLAEHQMKLDRLLALETKVNELAARLQSVEQVSGRNEADLAAAGQNIKTVTDEIEILQKFQTTTEKTHSLIQAAFADMGAGMSSIEAQQVKPQISEPQEASQGPEGQHEQAEHNEAPETYNVEL